MSKEGLHALLADIGPLSPPPPTEPHVGIFWTYQGKLFHLASCPLSEGTHTEISIDYSLGHYSCWFIMGQKGILNRLPQNMREEYDSIPRGRVVYLFEEDHFVIYHGDDFAPELKHELMEKLNLPPHQTRDDVDEHYNPLPEDFLF
ncbi:MAG: hypothetical protein MI717_11785 [Spirochaetales bacterium]|nr:hypothetical protein [Spirochaetales bacterium]